MTAKFFAILTNQGAARLANATALGTKLNLTQLAVGDGGGTLPTPDPAQTALLGEKRRAALNLLSVDPTNSSQIIAEQIIPENEGGFWIREIGLYDDAGVLIAVANCPETYKPQLQEGSGRTQTIRMVLIVSSTAAVTLKIDPSVVLATRKYVDDRVIEVKAYADNLLAQHMSAVDPHPQYAPKTSPALTGKPTAPTAVLSENSTQLATTEFVQALLAALVASSPAQLDTLKELADALGNDPDFSTTVINALAGKQPKDTTLSNLSGKDVSGLLQYLGLSQVAKKDANNIFSGSNTFNGGTALSADTTLDGIGLASAIDGKQPIDATLTALAGLVTGANKLPYFTGADAAGLADLSAFIRTMLGKTDAAATRTYLGLGNVSQRDVGTANGQIPDMSAWTRGGPGTARWRKSPDGLIEQWGSAGVGDAFGHAVVNFPVAFSSAPDGVFFGSRNVTVPDKITGITLDESKLSNTGFECRCLDQLEGATTPSTSNFYWFARGY